MRSQNCFDFVSHSNNIFVYENNSGCSTIMAACIITFFCCCSFFSLDHRFLTTANWKEANEKKIRICARNVANTIDNSIATLVWSKCRVPFVSGANNNNNERRHRLKKKRVKFTLYPPYWTPLHFMACVLLALFRSLFLSFAIFTTVQLQYDYMGFGHCVKLKRSIRYKAIA